MKFGVRTITFMTRQSILNGIANVLTLPLNGQKVAQKHEANKPTYLPNMKSYLQIVPKL